MSDGVRRPVARRILCVTSNFPRWKGDATTPFVLHLAQDLQSLGWSIDVLAPHAEGAAREEFLDGVRVERFRYLLPESQQTVCYRGGALINLRRQPANYLKLPALVAAEWVAVARRLAARPYALLHSHWILPQGFVGALVPPWVRRPHLITAHGGDVFGLRAPPLRAAKRWALQRADAVSVNSSVTERAVRELAGVQALVRRIPMGVTTAPPTPDQERAAMRLRRQHCSAEEALLLFVGRLVQEKGPADLLEAVQYLSAKGRAIRALIVGDGQDGAAFERLARELGVATRVEFTGWIDAAELPVYRLAADILVAPSRTAADGWVEAQGLSLLEGMAVARPVIATACGGIVDSVQHEQTGLLVPERDGRALAQAIDRLLADSDLRCRLGAAARQQVIRHFSREASARAFSELFEALLSGADAARAGPRTLSGHSR